MKQSVFGTLGTRDLVNGLVVAFLSSFLTGLVATLEAGTLPTLAQLKSSLLVGLAAGVSYLLKNFLTNSQGQLMTTEGK
jgi:VIT1/CCC1 family predicted Fe2+/Mn2+ transporter